MAAPEPVFGTDGNDVLATALERVVAQPTAQFVGATATEQDVGALVSPQEVARCVAADCVGQVVAVTVDLPLPASVRFSQLAPRVQVTEATTESSLESPSSVTELAPSST